MATMQATMDGSRIKAFVEDEGRFSVYADKKFETLDTDHSGTLTPVQLKPMVKSLGEALGLPPMGSSAETDHLYDEVAEEFTNGNRKKAVEKDSFKKVLKDILLGLADGLERDPITMQTLDGEELRKYATSETLEVDVVSIFTRLDVGQEGRLPSSRVFDVLPTIPVSRGMPPAVDPKVQKLVESAALTARINPEESLDQFQFVDVARRLLLTLADIMKQKPQRVAYCEKQYDGESIKKLLQHPTELKTIVDETWSRLPKDRHHKVAKDYLRVGMDDVAPAAGLPPLGSAEEVDSVLKEIYTKSGFDDGHNLNKEEFYKDIKEMLGGLMLHLGGTPVTIKSTKLVDADDEQ